MTNFPDLKEDAKEFKKRVEQLKTLPTLPHLMAKFQKMAVDPNTSMAKFGDEVSKDQVITSKLLKLVNSAYYGFPGRIGTVTQALVLLGLDALKGLIITSSVFDGLSPEAYPLWRHSILVSLVARNICNIINFPDTEEVTVAGLLHDIGKVILFLETPDKYRTIIKESSLHKTPMWITEKEIIGFNHTDIGKWVCEKWTLPDKLAVPITYHHEPENVPDFQKRTLIITAADLIVKAMGVSAENNNVLENMPDIVTKTIQLSKNDILDIINKIKPEIENLEQIGPGDLN